MVFSLIVLLLIPINVLAQIETALPEIESDEVTLESINNRLQILENKLDELLELLKPIEKDTSAEIDSDNIHSNETIEFESGIYLVPNDMKYGVWKYQSDIAENKCEVVTYSNISTDYSNRIESQYAPNGYITIDEKVKLVELASSWGYICTIQWVSEN